MFGIARAVCMGNDEERESGEKERTVVQGEGEAGGRRAELVDEAHEDCAWSSTQAFRDGECAVMRQP